MSATAMPGRSPSSPPNHRSRPPTVCWCLSNWSALKWAARQSLHGGTMSVWPTSARIPTPRPSGGPAQMENLPPNEYLQNSGVQLVQKYAELEARKADLQAAIKVIDLDQ